MSKERLVELIREAQCTDSCGAFDNVELCNGCCRYEKYKETADYLLANGVVVPPCKVGDKIYKPWKAGGRNVVAELVVIAIISAIKDVWSIKYKKIGGTICYQADINDFGKTVFLTREEAEAKLREGESNA